MCVFTSIFVEQMEVLEYRQKFGIEGSTKTETPRKVIFSLTCVVRVSIWVSEKFARRYLSKEYSRLNEIFGVCCN